MPTSPSGSPSMEPTSTPKRTPKPSERVPKPKTVTPSKSGASFGMTSAKRQTVSRVQLMVGFLIVPFLLALLYFVLKPGSEFSGYIGIGVALWSVVVIGAFAGVLEWTGRIKNRWMHLLLIPYVVIATDLALYESEVVNTLGVLSLLVLFFGWITLATRAPRQQPLVIAGHELLMSLIQPFVSIQGSWLGSGKVTQQVLTKGSHAAIRKGVIGFLVAVPIFLVFLGLLAAADPVFSEFVENVTSLEVFEDLTWEFIRGFLHFFVGATLIGYVLLRTVPKKKELKEKPAKQRYIQKTILGTLVLLFVAFLFVQVRALFGGDDFVQEYNLTYSEYARQGFFQLWWVSALALVVSGFVYWKTTRKNVDRVLSGIQGAFLGLTLLMAVSALVRLQLYITTYGLTHLRIFAYAGILLAALALVGQAYVVLARKPFWWFTTFATWLVIGWMTIMLTMNVDWQIANYNVSLADQSDTEYNLDMPYLNRLSLDAAGIFDRIPEEQRVYCTDTLSHLDSGSSYVGYFPYFRGCRLSRYGKPDIRETVDWRLDTFSHRRFSGDEVSSLRPFTRDEVRAFMYREFEAYEKAARERCSSYTGNTELDCLVDHSGVVDPEQVEQELRNAYGE